MTTRLDLPALKALCEAATPGPWSTHKDTGFVWSDADDNRPLDMVAVAGEASVPDAAFIAAARTALPALIEEVERLRADVGSCTSRWTHYQQRAEAAEDEVERLRALAPFVEFVHEDRLNENCRLEAEVERLREQLSYSKHDHAVAEEMAAKVSIECARLRERVENQMQSIAARDEMLATRFSLKEIDDANVRAHERGAAAERAAILEFIRTDVEHGGESCNCLLTKADAIEGGAHHATAR